MDVFFEQIVKINKTTARILLQVFIIVIAASFILIGMIFALIGNAGFFSVIGIFVSAIAGYGAYRFVSALHTEYEYAVTNGYFDVDKIIAKRTRKRILSIRCSEIESFGKYDPKIHACRKYNRSIVAGNYQKDNTWYATMHLKGKGYTLLIFQPNERILKAFKKFLPNQVVKDAFNRN